MTVSSTLNRAQFNCDGTTVSFPFTFKILEASDVQVYLTDPAGTSELLVLNVDYEIELADPPPGGTLSFLGDLLDEPPETGYTLTLLRFMPRTQEVDFRNGDSLDEENIEGMGDKLTMIVQDLDEKVGRSVILPPDSGLSGIRFPAPAAGKIFRWNQEENGLENVSLADAGMFAINIFWDDILSASDTTLEEALATMGINPGLADMTDYGASLVAAADAGEALAVLGITEGLVLDEVAEIPNTGAGQMALYAKDVGGTTELFARKESSGEELQLTGADTPGDGILKPEDFGAVGDGTTDDTAALQAFFDNSARRGELTSGKTYLVDTVTIPGYTRFWGDSSAVIKHADPTGVLVQLGGSDIGLRGFTIDGNHDDDSYANGYIAGHYGIKSAYAAGTPTEKIALEGLTVQNCGQGGIDLRLVTNCKIEMCNVSRCGYSGIAVWSGLLVWIEGNKVDNVYPGSGGSAPELNAYGIVSSNYSGDRVSDSIIIINNQVSNVTSWTGIDEHNGKYVTIMGNRVSGCGQGICAEHHVEGAPLRNLHIIGNKIVGYYEDVNTTSFVRDGQTYYMTGGIIVNGGINTEQGQSVIISNNILRRIGDSRTGGGNCGTIKCQNIRGLVISGNQIFIAFANGIFLSDDGTDSIFYHQVTGNVIDAVIEVNSVKRGFYATGRILGSVVGNFANNSGTAFSQVNSPTYITSFAENVTN